MVEVEMLDESTGPSRASVITLLDKIASSLPAGQSRPFIDSVIPTLLAAYDNPPLHAASALCPEITTPEHYREVLFFPTSDAAAHAYTRVLPMKHTGAKPSSMQITFLAMLYLCHISSPGYTFASSFIKHGGLQTLTDLFQHPNLHFRGQIVDTFLQITSHEDFDWFAKLDKPANVVEVATGRTLHAALLSLTKQDNFLKTLLASNPLSTNTFPGGTFLCLQILGFYLSWIRALHTPDNNLSLSRGSLTIIKQWSECKVWSGTGEIAEGEILAEEAELGTKLYNDFIRYDAVDTDEITMSGNNTTVDDDFLGAERLDVNYPPEGTPLFIQADTFGEKKEGYLYKKGNEGMGYYWDYGKDWEYREKAPGPVENSKPKAASKVDEPPAAPASAAPPAPPQTPREIGNSLFASGDYAGAIAQYGVALAAGSAADLDDELDDPLPPLPPDERAVLHANRAACYLKIVQTEWNLPSNPLTCTPGNAEGAAALQMAEAEARAAVSFNASYAKGYYRLAQAVALKGDLKEAMATAKSGISKCKGGKGVDELDEIVGGCLKKLNEEEGGGGKEAGIMAKILGRRDYGKELRRQEVEMLKKEKEEKMEGGGKKEEDEEMSAAEAVVEEAEEGKEEAVASLVPYKKKKQYEDDDSDVEGEVEGGARSKDPAAYEELDGPDSDDDDAAPRRKKAAPKQQQQQKAAGSAGSKENVRVREVEEIQFVKRSTGMDDILGQTSRTKKEKAEKKVTVCDGKKITKKTKKKEDGGLSDVLKMAGGVSKIDFS
jgi:hypothetical protein